MKIKRQTVLALAGVVTVWATSTQPALAAGEPKNQVKPSVDMTNGKLDRARIEFEHKFGEGARANLSHSYDPNTGEHRTNASVTFDLDKNKK